MKYTLGREAMPGWIERHRSDYPEWKPQWFVILEEERQVMETYSTRAEAALRVKILNAEMETV